ncbi:MAG TPA: MFS transporter [Bacteroidales bacterium]|nr:MFS transporter [Bacteroidales bacterium]
MSNISTKPAPPVYLRWIVLLFISLAMFGNYYIYDSISPVADLLKSQLKFSDSNIGLLMAIYSLPNVFMVLIGGIIIDRIGTKKAAFLFSLLMMTGGFITALNGNLALMATGRLIFGLGAESMIVAITTAIARWFKGKELSFAFGLNLTIARIGSFMALNSPSWGKSMYNFWQNPLWFAAFTGIISVVCLIIYWLLDKYSEKKYELEPEGKQDKVEFKEMFAFGKSFWFITALCITFYSAMFPFQTFAIKFFQEVHGESREIGGFLSSILTLSAMVATPLFGLLADKIGKRSYLMMIGSLLIVPVYLMMAYKADISGMLGLPEKAHIAIGFLSIDVILTTNLLIPMIMMGIAFSLVPAVLWPSVALVVKQNKLGTGYGLMTMIQNIGLAGFNLIIGFSNDIFKAGAANPSGYIPGMWIFSSLGLFGVAFAIILKINEAGTNGHGLDK